MWNPQPAKNQLKLIDGYKMLINSLPNSLYRSRGVEMGGDYIDLRIILKKYILFKWFIFI